MSGASVLRGPFCDCRGVEPSAVVRCPRRGEPSVDCVPAWPVAPAHPATHPGADQPFLRYRDRLWAADVARADGMSGAELDEMIGALDDALVAVAGVGVRVGPLVDATAVAAASGRPAVRLVAKDETGQPSGSHKVRHVFGTALHVSLAIRRGELSPQPRLAVASCGNAALAAATVALAASWPIEVFVPPDGHPAVLAALEDLGADVTTCARDDEPGDPCHRRLLEAVSGGALAFGSQGPDNALCLDGGRTLGWELADQAARRVGVIDDLVIQVGGGALASSVALGLSEAVAAGVLSHLPRLHALQAAGAAPLARAVRIVATRARRHGVGSAMAWAVRHRDEVMWPWEDEPQSCATGILDDETYDWAAVTDAVLSTGGSCPVVTDAALRRANGLVRDEVGVDADETGTAGVAGFLDRLPELADGTTGAVLLTGARRDGR